MVAEAAPEITAVPDLPPNRSERSRRSFVKLALATADLLALATAIAAVSFVIAHPGQIAPLFLVLPVWALLTGFYGLYRRDRVGADNATLDEVWPIFHCVTVATWLVFVLTQLTPIQDLHGGHMAAFWVIAILAVPIYRSIVRAVLRSRTTLKQNAVVVGAGLVGQEIARKIMRQPHYGLQMVGFVDADPLPLHQELVDVPVLGSTDDLAKILEANHVEHVVLAFTADHEAGLGVVRVCNELGVQVDIVPRLFEVVGSRAAVYSLEGTPLHGPDAARARHEPPRRQARDGRRSAPQFGLILLSPFFLAAAIAIKLGSKGPVFFRQTRIGRGQKAFTIVKFRTMVADAEERKAEVAHLNEHRGLGDDRMFKITDDPRSHEGRQAAQKDLRRRVPAALERAARRDEPCRPATAHPARAQVRERLGPQAPRPHARPHRPLAGLRPQRGHVLTDAGARLPVRHQLEPLGRHHPDPPHRACPAGQDARRQLAPGAVVRAPLAAQLGADLADGGVGPQRFADRGQQVLVAGRSRPHRGQGRVHLCRVAAGPYRGRALALAALGLGIDPLQLDRLVRLGRPLVDAHDHLSPDCTRWWCVNAACLDLILHPA